MRAKQLTWFLLLAAGSASANIIGNDTQNFNPVSSGLDFVTVHGSRVLDPGIFASSFFLSTAKNSLPDSYDVQGNLIDSTDQVTFGEIGFGYGLRENWGVGVNLSYLLRQDTDKDESGARFGATGLNEIRLSTKYALKKRNPWGAAIVASMNINTSKNNPFSGTDSGPTANLETVLDYDFGNLLVAGNLGYRARQKGSAIPGSLYTPLPNQVIASLAASSYLESLDTRIVGEVFAVKATESSKFVDSNKISSEFLIGAKHDLTSAIALQAGGGARLAEGLFAPDWRIYAGLNFSMDLLKLPTPVAGPDAPVPAVVKEEALSYRVKKGFMPEDIKRLKDASFDDIAKAHEFQLRTDVPEKTDGEKPPFEIVRLEGFDFDFGSSKIRPEYHSMLDRLGRYLSSQPKVMKVQVEGHTDSVGSAERNRIRSQERADSVKAYLEKSLGQARIPMEAVGYGASRPIADNSDFQSRKMNRRVEVRILRETTVAPESVEPIRP